MFTLKQGTIWPYNFILEFNGEEVVHVLPAQYTTHDITPEDVLDHPLSLQQWQRMKFLVTTANDTISTFGEASFPELFKPKS